MPCTPCLQQAASRGPAAAAPAPGPASLGCPHRGFPWGAAVSEPPPASPRGRGVAAGSTVPLTAEDSLFLQHHLTGVELQGRRRPSARQRAASSTQDALLPGHPPPTALVKHFWGGSKGPDRHSVTGCWRKPWPLTFWGLKMILYLRLRPDILSALTISADRTLVAPTDRDHPPPPTGTIPL